MKRLWQRLRAWRRFVGRDATMIRWLGLSLTAPTDEPGLLLIQIDGLSREQFETAIRRRRMKFVSRLIGKEGYRLHSMYSGLPSTTPAVQGELFFGVRCAVPAFGFRDPASGCVVRMLETEPAAAIEKQLAAQRPGVLALGSAYTNIYTGGAAESHFCAATMGWNGMVDRATPLTWLGIVLLNWLSVLRTFYLMFVELGVGIYDAIVGHWWGQKLATELNLIPSRVVVGVGLRELSTIGASMDLTRGLRVVQLNFLAYDEQSHRRGPGSRFAHYSLRAIDNAIRRLVRAARSSDRRKYEVWIYSDHGQEPVVPYESLFGRSIQDAVAEVFGETAGSGAEEAGKGKESKLTTRRQWVGGWKRKKTSAELTAEEAECKLPKRVEVVGMGPVGHVYFAEELDAEGLDRLAERLVAEAQVPMVLRMDGADCVIAWTAAGRFCLPEEAAEIVGREHPFLNELGRDLVCLCRHEGAGKLVICGWLGIGKDNVTFVDENGAHGGPGPAETGAFILVPESTELTTPARGFLRAEDFYDAVQMRLRGQSERK